MTRALPMQRWQVVLGGVVLFLLLVLLLGTSQGRSAGADFLAQFRGEQPEAASLSTEQIANIGETLSDLEHFGTLDGIDTAPELRRMASVADASEFVGFDVLQPDPAALPDGIDSTPGAIFVVPAHELRFTVDLEQAHAYFQATGQDDVNLPARFDGASLVVHTPPSVLLQYRNVNQTTDSPGLGLVIGQAGTVTADTEGDVTLEELRDFLVGLPGLSPDTVQQLRRIDEWRTTLPIPIPADQILWERATIAGSLGLLLNDNTGLGSAAIWQRDGRIYAIAGAVKAQEIQNVAETLR